MSKWKPIETAPNEETILVHHDNGDIFLIDADDNEYEWQPYDGVNGNSVGITKPTHWMPLPKPPTNLMGGK